MQVKRRRSLVSVLMHVFHTVPYMQLYSNRAIDGLVSQCVNLGLWIRLQLHVRILRRLFCGRSYSVLYIRIKHTIEHSLYLS